MEKKEETGTTAIWLFSLCFTTHFVSAQQSLQLAHLIVLPYFHLSRFQHDEQECVLLTLTGGWGAHSAPPPTCFTLFAEKYRTSSNSNSYFTNICCQASTS
jgi:hypothetical protein